MASSYHKGFTLMEILIVIALIGVIAGLSALVGIDTVARGTVSRERDTLVSLLTGARTQALANVDQSAHGVRITDTNFIVFEGTTYISRAVTKDAPVPRTGGVTISGPAPIPMDIIFTPLSGDVSAGTGNLDLSDAQGHATITINDAGGIDW